MSDQGRVMVVHAFNSSAQKAETCGYGWVQDRPDLQSLFLDSQSCYTENLPPSLKINT